MEPDGVTQGLERVLESLQGAGDEEKSGNQRPDMDMSLDQLLAQVHSVSYFLYLFSF